MSPQMTPNGSAVVGTPDKAEEVSGVQTPETETSGFRPEVAETQTEIVSRQQQEDIHTIQNAYNEGRKSTLQVLEAMWKAGKASIHLQEESDKQMSQTSIAELCKVSQSFVSYAIKFYRKFPKFSIANPPRILKGKTMREVWHDVLPKSKRKTTPKPAITEEKPPDPLEKDKLSWDCLSREMDAGVYNRIERLATERNLSITKVIARLLTLELRKVPKTQEEGLLTVNNPPLT